MSYEWTDPRTGYNLRLDSGHLTIWHEDPQKTGAAFNVKTMSAYDRTILAHLLLGDPDAVIIRSDELPEVAENAAGDLVLGDMAYDAREPADDRWQSALDYLALWRYVEHREQTQAVLGGDAP